MKFGLLGEKLGHSFSPDIHKRLLTSDYVLKEIPRDGLDDFLKKRDFSAINVTIPYKQAVIPYLHYISDKAREIGAVNVVKANLSCWIQPVRKIPFMTSTA